MVYLNIEQVMFGGAGNILKLIMQVGLHKYSSGAPDLINRCRKITSNSERLLLATYLSET